MSTNQPILPHQYTGKEINAEKKISCPDEGQSRLMYETAKHRLQNVNQWHELSGELSASFQLFDNSGEPVNRAVQKGDYFRVDIPGPGSSTGEGYDWVLVEELVEEESDELSSYEFRVRPAPNPMTPTDKTAHFFSNESTSTFSVKREKQELTAGIYDRNTKPNKEAANILDKTRNIAIATGALGGLSKLHWQHLVNKILE